MGNSSSPTAAGVLSIVSGVFGIILGAGMILFTVFFINLFSSEIYFPEVYPPEDFPFVIIEAVYLGWGIFTVLMAALAVIGGIYTLQRRHWGLALAGSIAAILVCFPTGIAAVILVAMSKNEFNRNSSLPKGPAYAGS